MFTLKTSFKLLFSGGGVKLKSVVEVTVNSKEDFCPNYVQEFGHRGGCPAEKRDTEKGSGSSVRNDGTDT
jgi:hypothetical protein